MCMSFMLLNNSVSFFFLDSIASLPSVSDNAQKTEQISDFYSSWGFPVYSCNNIISSSISSKCIGGVILF